MPSEVDLTGACEALLRIQDVYDVNVSQIASGQLPGVQLAQNFTGTGAFIYLWSLLCND